MELGTLKDFKRSNFKRPTRLTKNVHVLHVDKTDIGLKKHS